MVEAWARCTLKIAKVVEMAERARAFLAWDGGGQRATTASLPLVARVNCWIAWCSAAAESRC